jgi:uncharacterized membrane protein YhaH (DUF805 family)
MAEGSLPYPAILIVYASNRSRNRAISTHMLSQLDPATATAARFLWSSQGTASRRQWWFGHLAALLLACFGFVGAMGIILSAALGFGLDPSEIWFQFLTIIVASLCLLQIVVASNALSRRRLAERGEPRDLVDAFMSVTAIEIALSLNAAARETVAQWPLPAAPGWLSAAVATISLASLVALVFECGVFESLSLTEIWRGRRSQRFGGRLQA